MPDNESTDAVTKHLALPAFAKRKVGPLPVYGWAVIGAGLVGGVWFFKRRNAASTPSALTATDYSGGTGTGGSYNFGGGNSQSPGGGSVGGGSGGSGGGTTTPQPAFVPKPPPKPTPVTTPTTQPVQPSYVPTPGQSQSVPTPSAPHAVPAMVQTPTGPTAGVPSAPIQGPAPLINIPQTWLTPGKLNRITSPGGTIGGFEGWSAWVKLPNGTYQQYADGEYSAKGENLYLLPDGLSLPNGLTARPKPAAPSTAG